MTTQSKLWQIWEQSTHYPERLNMNSCVVMRVFCPSAFSEFNFNKQDFECLVKAGLEVITKTQLPYFEKLMAVPDECILISSPLEKNTQTQVANSIFGLFNQAWTMHGGKLTPFSYYVWASGDKPETGFYEDFIAWRMQQWSYRYRVLDLSKKFTFNESIYEFTNV